MTQNVKQRKSKHTDLLRALRFLGPYKRLVAVSILCALMMAGLATIGMSAILPILQVLINGQTVSGWMQQKIAAAGTPTPIHLQIGGWAAQFVPDYPVSAIAVIFGSITVIVIISNVFRFFQEHLSDRVAIFAVNDMRRHMYDHVLHMPLAWFGRFGTSDVTSRLVNDAAQLQDGFRILLGQTIQAPIFAVASLGLAFWIDWRLTLLIVLFFPAAFWVMRKLGTKVRRAMRAALQKSASMLGQIESTLQGVRVVKSSRAERFERRRYGRIMSQLIREQLRMSRYEAITTPAMETMALIATGLILLVAAWMMFEKKWLEPTSFMMIMIALGAVAEPMRRLSKLNNVIQRSNAAARRMLEIMDLPAERERSQPARGTAAKALARPSTARRVLPPIEREIFFDNVSFAYPGVEQNAVDGVTLRVGKGQSVAVVGRNGSGKTTLLALLPRFYDPTSGAVLIDGVDLRQVTLRSLRRQIAIVTQESIVFPGTIAENIAYGHPMANQLSNPAAADAPAMKLLRGEIEHAARRAFAHDFIIAKPQGYDTPLDGLGSQLSGGQKQRLCIARAILRKAPILILDEATSQVDAESEHLIQQAIENLMHQATTFVIAHRFSTILSADTIVVIDQGRIVGQGRHDALIRTCEVYQQLYERQMIGMPA